MSEWVSETLRSLVGNPISGTRPSGGVTTEDDGIPSLGGENVSVQGGMVYENINRVPPNFYRQMPKGHLQLLDVVINKDGAQSGKVGIYLGEFQEACVNEHLFILRSRGAIDQRYLYYSMLLPETQARIARRITGSAQPGLNSTFVDAVKVSLPVSRAEQTCIGKILMGVDAAIEQTEALIAKSEKIKSGVMYDLFTRGVAADGRLRPARAEAPGLYKWTPIGWTPKDWRYDFLSNLTLKIADGVHHTPTYIEHGIPFVTVKNLTLDRGINFTELNYISERDHRTFLLRADPKPGDVLVTKDGTLGISRIVEMNYPEFSIFVSVAQLRPIASILRTAMLHLFFEGGAYLPQLAKLSAGTGLKHIHLEHFRRFVIPLPRPKEQDDIAAIANSIDAQISGLEVDLCKLRYLRLGLMRDLLTGHVRADVSELVKTAA